MAKVKNVAVGADGALWCIDENDNLYEWAGGEWRLAHQHAVEVAVSNRDAVYFRTKTGHVYINTRHLADFHYQGGEWADIGARDQFGPGIQSIAATGNACWVVTSQGVPDYLSEAGDRVPHANDAAAIAAGNDSYVVYISHNHRLKLLRRSGGSQSWDEIPSPVEPSNQLEVKIQSVDIGQGGVLWVTDTRDNIYRRNTTGSWRRNDRGKAKQIAVGSDEHVYCVNDAGELFRAEDPGDAMTGWLPIAVPNAPRPTLLRPSTIRPMMRRVTVQQGDSVSSIIMAQCPDLTSDQLMTKIREMAVLNNLDNPDFISPGEVLQIPRC